MDFSCTARQVADHVVITVAGDLDLAAHQRFEAEIARAWDGSCALVVNLSRVAFLDSMGLRVLVEARQRAVDNGRDFCLAAPSEPVLRVLELAGVTSLFTVVEPSPDEDPDPDPDPAP